MSLPDEWIKHDRYWSEYPVGTKARENMYCESYIKTPDGWKWITGEIVPKPTTAREVLLPSGYMERMIKRKTPDKGHKVHRTKHNIRELIFAEKWANENERKRWINFGQGILQDLFVSPSPSRSFYCNKIVTYINKRDRMIAATIIQWLGTNVGFCFLTDCLDKCGYEVKLKDKKESP